MNSAGAARPLRIDPALLRLEPSVDRNSKISPPPGKSAEKILNKGAVSCAGFR